MKECWSEGDLRAYHDGELLPVDLQRVAAHLAVCPKCEALADEVAGRASRVAKLMSSLPEPRQVMWTPRRVTRPARVWPRWTAAAAALAAGLAMAFWPTPRPVEQVERVAAPAPVKMASFPPNVPSAAAPVNAVPVQSARVARSRPAPKRRAQDVFLALDDEPIETGMVIRVALGEAEIPAEVVFGKDGRPRAIRLVSSQQ
jgi:anti-sigma factor RsiW